MEYKIRQGTEEIQVKLWCQESWERWRNGSVHVEERRLHCSVAEESCLKKKAPPDVVEWMPIQLFLSEAALSALEELETAEIIRYVAPPVSGISPNNNEVS